jgi:hypothetical protein
VSSAPKSRRASQGTPLQHFPGNVSTHLRSWWAFGLQDTQTLPPLSAVIPAGRPCRCCSFAMFWSGHLPDTTLDGLLGPPDSPPPDTPHTDPTCPWCHSALTLLYVSSSAHDLLWLHIIHRLFMCPERTWTPSCLSIFVLKCCS